jgi:hypothetical protein
MITAKDIDEILNCLDEYIANHAEMSVDDIVTSLCSAAGALAASGGENPQELLQLATATLQGSFNATLKQILAENQPKEGTHDTQSGN